MNIDHNETYTLTLTGREFRAFVSFFLPKVNRNDSMDVDLYNVISTIREYGEDFVDDDGANEPTVRNPCSDFATHAVKFTYDPEKLAELKKTLLKVDPTKSVDEAEPLLPQKVITKKPEIAHVGDTVMDADGNVFEVEWIQESRDVVGGFQLVPRNAPHGAYTIIKRADEAEIAQAGDMIRMGTEQKFDGGFLPFPGSEWVVSSVNNPPSSMTVEHPVSHELYTYWPTGDNPYTIVKRADDAKYKLNKCIYCGCPVLDDPLNYGFLHTKGATHSDEGSWHNICKEAREHPVYVAKQSDEDEDNFGPEGDYEQAQVDDTIKLNLEKLSKYSVEPPVVHLLRDGEYKVIRVGKNFVSVLDNDEEVVSVPNEWYTIVTHADEVLAQGEGDGDGSAPEPTTAELVEMLSKREGVEEYIPTVGDYCRINISGEAGNEHVVVDYPARILVVKE